MALVYNFSHKSRLFPIVDETKNRKSRTTFRYLRVFVVCMFFSQQWRPRFISTRLFVNKLFFPRSLSHSNPLGMATKSFSLLACERSFSERALKLAAITASNESQLLVVLVTSFVVIAVIAFVVVATARWLLMRRLCCLTHSLSTLLCWCQSERKLHLNVCVAHTLENVLTEIIRLADINRSIDWSIDWFLLTDSSDHGRSRNGDKFRQRIFSKNFNSQQIFSMLTVSSIDTRFDSSRTVAQVFD